mmetsp:Transcript_14802/g.31062  ORF Transcript_14802/g.31062 Transcript_14802/m.31062 type:complete len:210 (+) Transcript_14802:1636-2265(+)
MHGHRAHGFVSVGDILDVSIGNSNEITDVVYVHSFIGNAIIVIFLTRRRENDTIAIPLIQHGLLIRRHIGLDLDGPHGIPLQNAQPILRRGVTRVIRIEQFRSGIGREETAPINGIGRLGATRHVDVAPRLEAVVREVGIGGEGDVAVGIVDEVVRLADGGAVVEGGAGAVVKGEDYSRLAAGSGAGSFREAGEFGGLVEARAACASGR